jgi:ectoine hydroxylase-related dioxygenase (phytanoyl-CoA dioxygenase family)
VVDDLAFLQFHQRGWFVAEKVFSDDECDRLTVEFEAAGPEIPLGEPSAGTIAYRPMSHLANPALRAAATDRRWAQIVRPLIGPDVRLLWDQLVAKPPGTRTELPWHQDSGYMPLDPAQYLVCWLALDDAGTDNGCLWVLPGSHHRGMRKHRGDGADVFRVGYDGDDRGVPVPAARGSVIVLSSLLLHRSGPNASDRPRRAWALQFCPSQARSILSGRTLDDRLRVAEDGEWLDHPHAERPLDLVQALGNHDRG